ncbi:DeoR/GlpR family DNA-binding transcription regulator [Vagococcus acidifermentans]|uniref:Lactose phosphotransferase system repressor n=1 Tax=Vagococcus acidifermentans TaxID=564710 RepID=A0A430AZ73_9ENTE|nr:DeoR/GlpR family DNA-binding transcription regulator [Vagococcus acidifermentans]RSU13326.1 DeoR family transcriptional regulator [Vagococcus acidifermentans]
MLKEERQQKIIDILNIEQKVIASDLSNRFNVSEDTIRRDLKELDSQKLLKRVHSGALRVGPPITDFAYRENLNMERKKALAHKALPFLKENSVIIIDGSTTNLALVKEIPLDFHATVITNSPPIAVELSQHAHIEVINIGGTLYKQSMINLGVETYKFLQNIRADLYIMGIYNIDIEAGTSVPTMHEAEIKQQMAKVSTEVLGMITNDKFGTVSYAIVGPVDDLSFLISENIPEKVRKEYNKKKLLLID